LTDLIGELSTRSEESRTFWTAHDVRLHRTGIKHFQHPVVGALNLRFDALELPGEPGLTLTVYSAEPGSPDATTSPCQPPGSPPTLPSRHPPTGDPYRRTTHRNLAARPLGGGTPHGTRRHDVGDHRAATLGVAGRDAREMSCHG
jgi:hypothetical protein